MRIIDITQEVFSCAVWPGDTAPTSERVKAMERDNVNVTNITMCVHNGTHVDAQCHFVPGGSDIASAPMDAFYGECEVVEFSGLIGEKDIAPVLAGGPRRLLLRGECQLSDGAAAAIARAGLLLVGVESQSVGPSDTPRPVHMTLLKAGVVPLEGLVLEHVETGKYILCAMPLKLSGSDGSPVRAVLIADND